MTRLTVAVALLLTTPALHAQAPAFEVASVRPSDADAGTGGVKPGPEGVTARGASLFLLIAVAYNLQDDQIAGPSWLRDVRYDVVAKASGPVRDQEALRQMLQTLLADRFKLVVHREQRPRQGFALLVAARGPKLQQAAGTRGGTTSAPGRLVFTAVTMPALARRLSQIVGEPVVDATAVTGAYDFTLDWQDGDAVGPSLFTAVEEQLGLRLESRTLAIDTLVIDRVERVATEN